MSTTKSAVFIGLKLLFSGGRIDFWWGGFSRLGGG